MEPDEQTTSLVIGHVLIRDRDSGEIVLHQRDGVPPPPVPGEEET